MDYYVLHGFNFTYSYDYLWQKIMNYEPKDDFDILKFKRKSKIKGEKDWVYMLGYRTSRSMKSNETFKFAQRLFAKYIYRSGTIIIIPSIFAMLFVYGENKNIITFVADIIVLIQCALIFCHYIPIERELKKNFDKDGNRIV